MIEARFLEALHTFIVRAKSATYVGDGGLAQSCRPGSHDLKFSDGIWSYLDSYFGGRDFIGEEVVFADGKAIWGMNYFGSILLPDVITPEQTGNIIKISLSLLYQEKRFLGGFRHTAGEYTYLDKNSGDLTHFNGQETIVRGKQVGYQLVYHGGLIKDD